MLNTNLATAVALLSWFLLDMVLNRKLPVVGAINGMICGLAAITPAAGYVDGTGAILMGPLGASIPWFTLLNRLSDKWPFRKADDTLGRVHTHFLAGVSVGGLLYGNAHQLLVQLSGLLVVTAYSGVVTVGILKAISLMVTLRMTDRELDGGDRLIFNEEVLELHYPGFPQAGPIDPLGVGWVTARVRRHSDRARRQRLVQARLGSDQPSSRGSIAGHRRARRTSHSAARTWVRTSIARE